MIAAASNKLTAGIPLLRLIMASSTSNQKCLSDLRGGIPSLAFESAVTLVSNYFYNGAGSPFLPKVVTSIGAGLGGADGGYIITCG